MSSTPTIHSQFGHLETPDHKATPHQIRTFLDRVCNHESPGRLELYSEWMQVVLAYESITWAVHPEGVDPRYCTQWTEPEEDGIPRPEENIILELADNERSRLGRRRPQAYVRPRRSNNVASKAGATVGDHVLDWTNERLRFDATHRDFVFNDVLLGTAFFCSDWVTDFRKKILVGAPGSLRCATWREGCDFKLSGVEPAIPIDVVNAMGDFRKQSFLRREDKTAKDGTGELVTKWHAEKCLKCGAPMFPFTPAQGADAAEEDAFGRPMGKETAMGDVGVRSCDPFTVFIQNEGLGMSPGPLGQRGHPNWYAEDVPEDVDDIACWYAEGDKVKPEDPTILAKNFPFLLGERASSTRWYGGIGNRTTYYNHARLRRFVLGPTRKFPKGRLIVMAGQQVLFNDDLVRSSTDERTGKTQDIPRVRYSGARFYPKKGMYFGQGQVVANLSRQRRINMRLSQFVDNAERNGNDGLIYPKGTKLLSPGWASGLAGRHLEWEPSAEYMSALPADLIKPQVWRATLMDSGIWQEIQFEVDRMASCAGLQDADVGKIVGSQITSGTMLQLAGEQSSQRRELKEFEVIDACKNTWQHMLMLQREFVREVRDYWVKGDNGTWEQKEFEGADLADSLDIIVDEEPHYNKGAFDREMHLKAAEFEGLIPLDKPYARREFRKELGLKSNVADAEETQVSDAERKWMMFVRESMVPTIDPSEDDPSTFFEQFGMGWKSSDGIRLKNEAEWDQILDKIAGWEKDLARQRQKQAEFEAVAVSGQLEAAIAAIQANKQAADEQTAQTGQRVMPLPIPPPGGKILTDFGPASGYQPPPESISQHILQIWMERLQPTMAMEGAPPEPPVLNPQNKSQGLVLRMKAVTEGYRILAEERKMVAQAGVPVQAMPGAEATPAGTEPTVGQPPEQGAAA